ncbi:MAG TPA: hypothetical protein VD886_09695, partial [Herpetosiphonaceae bacterium]|nr:hypothetical protein [Herpetosiphonaceae bacterium]
VFNVGSGRSITVREIALRMSAILGKEHIAPTITGNYRVGDIRHCFADIGLAREILGYAPQTEFNAGLIDLARWLESQVAVDHVGTAQAELAARGLTI